jgi:hypothetical protein
MADLFRRRDTGVEADHESTVGTPRWVKVFGIITVVVVLLFLILMFTRGPGGRGGHTPFRHFGGEAPSEGARP